MSITKLFHKHTPVLIYHRGQRLSAPENSMWAFKQAVREKALMIELDITQSLDQEIMVFHDDTVGRKTNGTGLISNKTLKEIKALKIDYNGSLTKEKIPTLKAVPERNKTYTKETQEAIFEFLETEDPILLLYIKFISYNFLRPIEVCRLKVGDINLEDKIITFKAKNSPLKTKDCFCLNLINREVHQSKYQE